MTQYLGSLADVFKRDVLPLPSRVMACLFLLFLLVLPGVTGDVYVLRIMTFTALYAMFAVSWQFLAGTAGQVSFGHASFFGAAAYIAALADRHLGLPVGATILLGALGGVAMGLVIGLPSLRLRGTYFTLVSFAFPVILSGIVLAFPGVTGGSAGITRIQGLADSPVGNYYIVVATMIVATLVMWKIGSASNHGVVLHGIREDEIAARACGINTPRYKLMAFCVSGFFAGVAGALYAHLMRVAGPTTLGMMNSFNPVIWTIFGGISAPYGAIAGTFVLYPLMDLLNVVSEIRMLIFVVVIMLILFFMPEGIAVKLRDMMERECPRCKTRNVASRQSCRNCGAGLRLAGGVREEEDRNFEGL